MKDVGAEAQEIARELHSLRRACKYLEPPICWWSVKQHKGPLIVMTYQLLWATELCGTQSTTNCTVRVFTHLMNPSSILSFVVCCYLYYRRLKMFCQLSECDNMEVARKSANLSLKEAFAWKCTLNIKSKRLIMLSYITVIYYIIFYMIINV